MDTYNTTYSCAESGHIMGAWMAYSGTPKPERYRHCVIPGCSHLQIEKAPMAPSGI